MQTLPVTKTTATNHTESSAPSMPCWAYVALWGFAWLCWLMAVAVDVFVTPGGDWLRHNGKSISWFTVGGGDEDIFGGCDVGLRSSQWCSYFAIFTVIQTTAAIIVSVAAVLLLAATCRRRPHRWCISSAAFFAIYAVLQAAALGLVIETARKLEDALVADGRVGVPSLSSSSSSISAKVEYGTILVLSFFCGVVGFNASLILFALSWHAPPEVDPLCDCLCRKRWRDTSRKRTGASTGSNTNSRRGSRTSNMISPTPSATGSIVGAASMLWVSRQPLAAPTHPRPRGSTADVV